MKKLLFLLVILSSFASGKNFIPLTDALLKDNRISISQLRNMPFYLSQDVILHREIILSNTSKKKDDRIVFKAGARGTFVDMPREGKILVSFGGDQQQYLSFGPSDTRGGNFVLLASDWNNTIGTIHYGGVVYHTDPNSKSAFLLVDGAGFNHVTPSYPGKNEVVQTKIDIPPIITITDNTIYFKDNNGNNAIDAFEKCKLRFEVKNTGKGTGSNLKVRLQVRGNTNGVLYDAVSSIPNIEPGGTYHAEIPVSGNANTEDGTVTFKVKVEEPRGFGSDETEIEIPTRAFASPLVKVVDYTITSSSGTNLARKQPFDLQLLVQNVKPGLAESIQVDLESPANVVCFSGNDHLNLGNLKAGDKKEIIYSLIVSDNYTGSTIPLTIRLKEKFGKYAEDKTITLNLNQQLSANKITIKANADNKSDIEVASLTSDVDKNIPTTDRQKENTYALIIGNENYSSYQHDLSTEANVDYASNDAQVFKEYCVKTLGIPEMQVKLLLNATEGQMNQGLAWLNNLAHIDGGNAELIFYYSGHGLPDEVTKEAYLVPVDVSGADVKQGIKLEDAYRKLSEFPSQKVSVFLDACFSGGARGQSLVAQKGIKIKPKENALSGNMVVFASSSGEESSGVYREKQHGYMTYFLLKKLQETRGEIRFSELADYISANVKKETALRGAIQTPQINTSSDIGNNWTAWKLK